MPKYLYTKGRASIAIGICDRCRRKFPIGELYEDPNVPGMRVCHKDRDVLDPYRLAPPGADIVTLRFTRPDTPMAEPSEADKGYPENVL